MSEPKWDRKMFDKKAFFVFASISLCGMAFGHHGPTQYIMWIGALMCWWRVCQL